MARTKTITVWANPYHALPDHEGRLHGGCPEAQLPLTGGAKPHHRLHGATRHATKGSHVADSTETALRIKGAPMVMSRADVFLTFSADPMTIDVSDPRLRTYYAQRVASGELLEGDALPIERLAKERAACIANWEAHYGDEPLPFDVWAEQYEPDPQVAAHAVGS
jgi:hypothetical protein